MVRVLKHAEMLKKKIWIKVTISSNSNVLFPFKTLFR